MPNPTLLKFHRTAIPRTGTSVTMHPRMTPPVPDRMLPRLSSLCLAATLAGAAWLSPAQAGVNPRNGNFFITYSLTGDASPTITYNSKAVDRGWYGYGWGSLFETRLIVMGDGSAVVLENGTGRQTAYGRRNGGSPEQQLVQHILDDVQSVEKLDPGEVEALRRTLGDTDARVSKVKAYGLSRSMADGASLKGEACDESLLRKIGQQYERRDCSGALDIFNEQGWLVSHRGANGQLSRAEYGRSPFPVAWIEPDGTRVSLRWNDRGQIIDQSRTAADGKTGSVNFSYDVGGNLVRMAYTPGIDYRFTYDDRHNLTEITYADNSTMRMAYDAHDAVVSVTERSGQQTRYEYATDPASGEDSTIIISTGSDGQEKRRSLRYARDGLPLRTEDVPGRWTEYRYHPVLRKVTWMRSPGSERRFEYDDKGQVTFAIDETSKRSARFTYDGQGRITRLLSREGDDDAKDMGFRYNDQGKPVQISLKGIGHIDVRYRADGEIESVHSPQGASISLAVTQAFQSMLSIVRMSGASLGF